VRSTLCVVEGVGRGVVGAGRGVVRGGAVEGLRGGGAEVVGCKRGRPPVCVEEPVFSSEEVFGGILCSGVLSRPAMWP